MEPLVSLEDILAAHKRIKPFIHNTPTFTSSQADKRIGGRTCVFKAESFQRGGAFKIRGAMNSILLLSEEQRKTGICTHSSGNHAQACAIAAKLAETRAIIVMPSDCPKVKKNAVKGYGAEIVLCEPNHIAREVAAEKIKTDTGMTLIHPSDDLHVIAGQGTAAVELLGDYPDLDCLVTPVGGGGLLSGCSIAAKSLSPGITVIGAEPLNANDAFRSKESNTLCTHESPPDTVADGLKTVLGPNTFPIVMKFVDKIFTATEGEIISAMRWVWERMKLVIEPSSAVAVAVLFSEQFQEFAEERSLKKIGVILSGGNVDLSELPF